jgi:serine/threonine-protein kinase HipA
LALLRLVAFSYVIANGDLHAKNISVLEVEGQTRLAPAYDLVSTLPYGDDRMALELEGRDKRLRRAHFIAFGERVGVRGEATERMLTTLVTRLERRLRDPSKPMLDSIGLGARETRHLERTIRARCAELDGGR